MTREKKSKPAVKQAKKKPKIEVADNRKKIVEQPKIVGKIEIPGKKAQPKNSQVAKFEKKFGKAKSGSYTLKEVLENTGVQLPTSKE